MSTISVVMMIVAMVTVWGGLLLALINIKRSPEEVDELDTPSEGSREDAAHRAATDGDPGSRVNGGAAPESRI